MPVLRKIKITDESTGDPVLLDLGASSGNVVMSDGSTTLTAAMQDCMKDVLVSNPTDGQVLTYDGSQSKWVNADSQGGGSSVKLADVTGANVTLNRNSATIRWTDPQDIVISNVTLAKWEGTKVVRKAGSAPETYRDGTLVVDSKVQNQYSSTGYVDSGLMYDTTYYYRFFPYTDTGAYTVGSSVSVTPEREVIQVPTQTGTLTYNESSLSPILSHSTGYTISGDTSATNAGDYIMVVSPTNDYKWSDGTRENKNVSWSIQRKSIEVPIQSGTITYDGTQKTPSWSHSEGYTIEQGQGKSYNTDAGTFTPIATLNSNYKWSDNTTSTKTLSWTISKAHSSITVGSSSVTLDTSNLSVQVSVSGIAGRNVSVSSSDTSIATASISNGIVTISHVNMTSGIVTVTVSVDATTNYEAETGTITVNASFVSSTLNDNSWSTIQSIAQAGTGSVYWKVGDRIEVSLTGTVRARTLSSYKWYAYILGFNHNSAKEGNNTIHFQFGFNALSGGVHTAMTDWTSTQAYGGTSGTRFCMNNTNTNSGGWNSSLMRTTTIPEFKSCLPSELQSALKAVTKYTDNTANGGGDTSSYVTATSDEIFLLSEFEIFGTRSYANNYEQNSQAQYSYYSAANSKVMYNDQVTGTAVYWWERSPRYNNSTYFCVVDSGGNASASYANYSFGFAPGFAVG